jgi:hypothetical protein
LSYFPSGSLSTIAFPLTFCSTTSDFVLRAAPHISEEYTKLASKIRIAFTGDPSFFAYNGEEEEPEPEDPDAPPVERFREVHRLTYTVKVRALDLFPADRCGRNTIAHSEIAYTK